MMPVAIRRVGWVDGKYVAPTNHLPPDGPAWAQQRAGAQSSAETRKTPQRATGGVSRGEEINGETDDEYFARMQRERAQRALTGAGKTPAPKPVPQKPAAEVVAEWIAAHAAEGISQGKAIADLQKRSPDLVAKWVAEVNRAAGRSAVVK
jgi:hypothetical protein